jgi:hypothetical protein
MLENCREKADPEGSSWPGPYGDRPPGVMRDYSTSTSVQTETLRIIRSQASLASSVKVDGRLVTREVKVDSSEERADVKE